MKAARRSGKFTRSSLPFPRPLPRLPAFRRLLPLCLFPLRLLLDHPHVGYPQLPSDSAVLLGPRGGISGGVLLISNVVPLIRVDE